MDMREAARARLTQNLTDRTRALGDHLQHGETPVGSSAGDLVLQEPMPPKSWSTDQIKAYFPEPEGDFTLTDRTLYYRDPRGEVYTLSLASIAGWRQRRSERHEYLPPRLQRRILEIEVTTSDGRRYLMESGKIFARQIRRTGRIRRRRW
ncbi:hypothetical protein [Streptomyces sp. NBC_00568]|uniref:hypothetical protein n=1 Tax=Streptomyces sp. NBC_00568 TaxID=2975779 RepID=UPI00225A3A4B|nr:hypothetical protein [Streptomyces sp. NBC_00568]MCX4993714.1 hypothetical protein [Streptomyces sp. NBC_00568]